MKIGFVVLIIGLFDLVFSQLIDKAITGKPLLEAYVVGTSMHHYILLTGVALMLVGGTTVVLSLNKAHKE